MISRIGWNFEQGVFGDSWNGIHADAACVIVIRAYGSSEVPAGRIEAKAGLIELATRTVSLIEPEYCVSLARRVNLGFGTSLFWAFNVGAVDNPVIGPPPRPVPTNNLG